MSAIKFAVEPRPGDKHQSFLNHALDLCNGNADRYQYLLDWMARAVQKPDAPGEVAVVFHGKRGTGKSLFAKVFGALFGRHFQVSEAHHLVGNFNASLRDCVVLFADGALRDKKCDRVLKTLLTEETIVVEQKGVDAEVVPNHVHLILASHEPWIVSAADDARRFFVLDVVATRVQANVLFMAMNADLEAGGYGHLLHALQTRDISNFEHRTVPRAEELAVQKIHSLKTHEEWWFGKLRDGTLQPLHAGWIELTPKDQLLDDYLHYAQRIGGKRASAMTVMHFLDRACPGMDQRYGSFRGRDVNGDPVIGRTLCLKFPSLKICREAFEGLCGGSFKWTDIGERETRPRVRVGGVVVTEAHLAESDQDHWQDLDAARRMFGVFDNIGYSADPIAIFRTKRCADEWLAWDMARGDDRVVWRDVCVLPIDDLTGRAWNSFDPAPVLA